MLMFGRTVCMPHITARPEALAVRAAKGEDVGKAGTAAESSSARFSLIK